MRLRNGLVGRLCEHERQKLNAKWGKGVSQWTPS